MQPGSDYPTDDSLARDPVAELPAVAPHEVEVVEEPYLPPVPPERPAIGRVALPVALFLASCATTYYVGNYMFGPEGGLIYMGSVMAIIFTHEMGHFLQSLRYRVPASLPYFIPMPLSYIGTMGAVIGMAGSRADRKEMFDIGISGPLAGLVLCVPATVYGVWIATPVTNPAMTGPVEFGDPLLIKLLIGWLHPDWGYGANIYTNPFLHAGWVGLLITGLNMMPVSQLDGGHVAYCLFGRRAHWVARGVILAAIAFIAFYPQAMGWVLMIALVLLIGPDHPPTSDDTVELGWPRKIIGFASLAIPLFCLAPIPLSVS